jgi:D-amino peptidase
VRVLMMSDMEGVSGIVDWQQVNGSAAMYEEGRRLYTEEINAAVRGARDAEATEIVALDCHGAGGSWQFNSLMPELLDPGCDWVAHHIWTCFPHPPTSPQAPGCPRRSRLQPRERPRSRPPDKAPPERTCRHDA